MLRQCLAILALLCVSPLAAKPAPDPAFAGHYYLSGVMETGSELLLKPDGRFEWFLAYGAVDQIAKGKWERRGATIALIADRQDTTRPLFALEKQETWNARAEEALREIDDEAAIKAIDQRCPFLQTSSMTTVAPILMVGEKPAPETSEKAKAALAIVVVKRGEAEQAMAAAIAKPSAALNAAALAARLAWLSARSDASQAYYIAGHEMPALDDAKLPAVCELPADDRGDVAVPAHWQRGVAVVVGDPDVGGRFSSIMVAFHYADGRETKDVTNSGGWAVAHTRTGAAVDAIALSFPDSEPPLAAVRFAITPLREGIQPVRFDSRQLAGAPFETLILRIDGKDLLPERGRYSRE